MALKDGFSRREVMAASSAATGPNAASSSSAATGSSPAAGAKRPAAQSAGSVQGASPAAVRLAAEAGIAAADAEVLTTNEALATLFSGVVEAGVDAVHAANWTINEVAPIVRDRVTASRLTPEALAALIGLVELAGYLEGMTGLRGFFIGQVMRMTQGRADPAQVQTLLDAALARAARGRPPG